MLEGLLGGVFAAATGGGAMGLLGGLFRQALDYFGKRSEIYRELEILKERNRHEKEMRQKDIDLQQAEAAADFKVIEEQGETAIEVERLRAVAASMASDKATFATGEAAAESGWFIAVDVMRGIIRPGITILFDLALLVIYGVLLWLLWDHLRALFIAKEPAVVKPMMDMVVEITKAIVFLATTATGYWFVARQSGGGRQ